MVGAGCSSQRSPGTTTPMPGGYASAIVAAAHLVDRHVVDLVSVLRHVSLPEHSLDEPRSRGEVYRSCRRHYGLQAADRIKENLSLCASTGAHRGRALTATGELLVHDRSVTSNVADRVLFRRWASGPIANGRPPWYSTRRLAPAIASARCCTRTGSGPIRADALRATAGPRAGAGWSSSVSDRRHADRRQHTHMLSVTGPEGRAGAGSMCPGSVAASGVGWGALPPRVGGRAWT